MTGVAPPQQKVLIKGQLKDGMDLKKLGIKEVCPLLLCHEDLSSDVPVHIVQGQSITVCSFLAGCGKDLARILLNV